MGNPALALLRRYRATLIAAMIVAAAGLWPALLAPGARAYLQLCTRALMRVPVAHHFPPFLVAFVVPGVAALTAGAVFALLRQALGQRRLDAVLSERRCNAHEHVRRTAARLGARGRVMVTADDAVYAFCGGLARPRIYLSRGLLDLLTVDEAEAVVRHELHHLSRRDPLRFFLSDLIRNLSPCFPVAATVADRVRINAELAADRATLDGVAVETLAAALLKVLRASPAVEFETIVAALSPTDARVAALLGQAVSTPIDWRDVLVSIGFAVSLGATVSVLALQSLPLPASCVPSCTPL